MGRGRGAQLERAAAAVKGVSCLTPYFNPPDYSSPTSELALDIASQLAVCLRTSFLAFAGLA